MSVFGKFVIIGGAGDRIGTMAESYAMPVFRITDFTLAEQIKPALLEPNQMLVVVAEARIWTAEWEQWVTVLPGMKLFWGIGGSIGTTGPWLTIPVEEKADTVWMFKGLFDAAIGAENVAKPIPVRIVSELLSPNAEIAVRRWQLPDESDRELNEARLQQICSARVAILIADGMELQRMHPRIAALVGNYLRRSYPTPSDRNEEDREIFQAIVLQTEPTPPVISIWYNHFPNAEPLTLDDVKPVPETEPVFECQTIELSNEEVPVAPQTSQPTLESVPALLDDSLPPMEFEQSLPQKSSIEEWERIHSIEEEVIEYKEQSIPFTAPTPAASDESISRQPLPPTAIQTASLALDPETAKLFAEVERISETERKWKPAADDSTFSYKKPGLPLRNILIPFTALVALTLIVALFSKNGSEASTARTKQDSISTNAQQQSANDQARPATEKPEPGVVLPPRELLRVSPGVAVVLVDKFADRLWVLKDNLILFETEVVTGGEHGGKRQEGDRRTPEGVYYITRIKEGLGAEYGGVALTLDYPNPLDRIEKRNGGGIWLHGVAKTSLNDVFSTRGCVAMLTPNLRKLIEYVKPYESLVYIRDREPTAIPNLKPEIEQFLDRWRNAWSARDIDQYLACYAESYAGDNGNFSKLKQHKTRIFQVASKIEVSYLSPTIIVQGNHVILHFQQQYRGEMSGGVVKEDNGLKRLFLQRQPDGFRIVSEEWVMQSSGAREVANR